MQAKAGWLAGQAQQDNTWVQRLTPEAVAGFDTALAHAKASGRPLIELRQSDFPLPAASREALARAVAATQGPWGLCLLRGFPVDRWTEDDCRIAYWGMGLHMGVARTQNRASDIMNDVRDAGGTYKVTNGRGYNTNAALDFHTDSSDVVALLCRRTAKRGGESKVVSSRALHAAFVRRRPDLEPVLREPFFYSYQGAQDPAQPPYYSIPLLGAAEAPFAFRINRKNVVAAQRDFPEVPRLTARQLEALDLIDELLQDPELCFSMQLEQGDMQLLNNYTTVHSRTDFEDHEAFDLKRHLLRLWLAIPGSQRLPDDWGPYYGDSRPGSVRGGLRGSARTQAFERYEQEQAAVLGMPLAPFDPAAQSRLAPEHAHTD
ncbi:TauD/TfdA family dioxygenase [Verticiella sediminum]|uniref:TauD/TfdA family dioxygenase n=1 Tax=Verticiella sediminum TaxID=1247510 RepID=A0A556AB21_9BURK|nr:TauD/TfdA family dioxygenase [Verticiella sediminum]TSH90071.1 TauD/TfdA family dioxygenase [Verticiella sediminum]